MLTGALLCRRMMFMGRGGSDFQRQLAAQRREEERKAREKVRIEKENEKLGRERHLAARQQEADAKTNLIEVQIKTLEEILTSILSIAPLAFERLMTVPKVAPFRPGALGTPLPAPDWGAVAPPEPGTVSRLLGGGGRYARQVSEARARHEAAVAQHAADEIARQRRLAAARGEHDRGVADERTRVAQLNAEVAARQREFAAGAPEAVEWFVSRVLEGSHYPPGFPRVFQVAYRPENTDVVVEFELPPQKVVPRVRGYKFVKNRDAIDPLARPDNEVKQRYKLLIARVALRTLHEIFGATPPDVVQAVVFNGRVSTIDRATGKPARPHLLSVSAERSIFQDLVLAEVDPAACLVRLNALVSPNPFDMEAVEPFIEFDLRRFRFMDDLDVVSGLDGRKNLLKLTPYEFEYLVKDLFVAMGTEAWNTFPSKDGGVDAVAVSKHLAFGGVCFIQAKRYTGVVGLEAVHALTGVMADHNATTGVLVTTSWFGRASEQFAGRNRITLINGAELKDLLKKYLNLDVIPGTTPPRRLRASDNTQTGRPGPTQ
jgi:restriction system protein